MIIETFFAVRIRHDVLNTSYRFCETFEEAVEEYNKLKPKYPRVDIWKVINEYRLHDGFKELVNQKSETIKVA